MTVTPESLPAAYGMGRVVARFLDAVGDGHDTDTLPEAVPATGTVMFTPVESDRIVPDATAEPTPIITHKLIEAELDAGGYLSRNGTRGLWLWAGQWKIMFSVPGMARQGWTIEVTTEHTELAPLDLWLSQPYTPPSGATVTTMLVPANPVDGYGLVWDAAEGRLVWGPVGGEGGTTSWSGITDKPAVIAAGADKDAARAAIDAGTSSLAIGTGATDAAPGNHDHDDRYVRTVNNASPDVAGNVDVAGGGGTDALTVVTANTTPMQALWSASWPDTGTPAHQL